MYLQKSLESWSDITSKNTSSDITKTCNKKSSWTATATGKHKRELKKTDTRAAEIQSLLETFRESF
jgi:hypothetical protein